ncbi:MAG TPA: putative glycoside hydrolase [Baekduia sp.]
MADVAGHVRLALATPSQFPALTTTAKRSSYVVLQAWDTAKAAQLKAANPNVTVLMYQNASAMAKGAGAGGVYSSGVGMEQADTAHPDWFLKDTSGKRITEGGYDWLYMADVGNASYASTWAANVLARLNSGPWDGVFMDDVNTTAAYHTDPSKIAAYPNDASYQAATRALLAIAGPRIRAAGKLAIANIGSWSENPTVAKDWLQFLDGGMDEMFVKWSATPGVGYRPAIDWKTQINAIQAAEAMGKRYLAVTQAGGDDTQAQLYGWASVLMAANKTTAYLAGTNYNADPTWLPEYDAHIGDPAGAATALGNGAYTRKFSNGLVVVNPSGSTVKVAFGGAYSGSGLTNATSATLAPDTALVLTKGDQATAGPILAPGDPTPVVDSPQPPSPSSGGTPPSPSSGGPTASAPVTQPAPPAAPKPVVTSTKKPVKKTTKKPATKSTKKSTSTKSKAAAKARAARLAKQRKKTKTTHHAKAKTTKKVVAKANRR